MKKVLIIDAFTRDLREWVRAAIGGHGFAATTAATVHKYMGQQVHCDPFLGLDELPDAKLIRDYDGIIWTGSAVSSYKDGPHREHLRQWMHICIDEQKPIFGICFGFQMAAVIAGGTVERNPAGLETLIARRIRVTDAGRSHPMMHLRNGCYDAVSDHEDHVVALPEGSICLAGNDNTAIQAGIIKVNGTEVWGVQYHPELDMRVVHMLLSFRKVQLLEGGFFENERDLEHYRTLIDRLIATPAAKDAAWQLGFDADVMDERRRIAELECWLRYQVLDQGDRSMSLTSVRDVRASRVLGKR